MDTAAFTKRIQELPATLQASTRARIARSLEQLRIALDLPSRKELAELTARLEALDARIASLAAERVAEMGRTVPTLAAGEPEGAAVAEPVAEPEAETDADADAGNGAKKKPLKNKR